MPKELIMDFDDFSEESNNYELLRQLKLEIPNLKVTLFTVPALCSKEFCKYVLESDWIELALHGEFHNHLECSTWTKDKALEVLNKYEEWGCFKKVFKPPYWEGSEGLYQALQEKGYILAQNKNIIGYRKLYLLNENSIHGHITNVCGNGLEEKFNYYKSLKGNTFKFISELYE